MAKQTKTAAAQSNEAPAVERKRGERAIRMMELFTQNIGMRVPGDKKSDTAFRKHVISQLATEFGVTIGNASGTYNKVLQQLKVSNPELVADLGRPEGYTGGNRKKAVAAAE